MRISTRAPDQNLGYLNFSATAPKCNSQYLRYTIFNIQQSEQGIQIPKLYVSFKQIELVKCINRQLYN